MTLSETNMLLLRYKDALSTILTIISGIVAQTNTTLAAPIREIASAQVVASDRLVRIMFAPGCEPRPQYDMNQMLKCYTPKIPQWNFEHKIRIPARPVSTQQIDVAIEVLKDVRDLERAFSLDTKKDEDFSGGVPDVVKEYYHVLRGSETAVWLLERILRELGAEPRFFEDQPTITHYCTRCLAWADADELDDCKCGAKKNYLRRCFSVP